MTEPRRIPVNPEEAAEAFELLYSQFTTEQFGRLFNEEERTKLVSTHITAERYIQFMQEERLR